MNGGDLACRMKVVGLTGGIATGKSAVSAIIESERIPLVDCDKIAHAVVKKVRSSCACPARLRYQYCFVYNEPSLCICRAGGATGALWTLSEPKSCSKTVRRARGLTLLDTYKFSCRRDVYSSHPKQENWTGEPSDRLCSRTRLLARSSTRLHTIQYLWSCSGSCSCTGCTSKRWW